MSSEDRAIGKAIMRAIMAMDDTPGDTHAEAARMVAAFKEELTSCGFEITQLEGH